MAPFSVCGNATSLLNVRREWCKERNLCTRRFHTPLAVSLRRGVDDGIRSRGYKPGRNRRQGNVPVGSLRFCRPSCSLHDEAVDLFGERSECNRHGRATITVEREKLFAFTFVDVHEMKGTVGALVSAPTDEILTCPFEDERFVFHLGLLRSSLVHV